VIGIPDYHGTHSFLGLSEKPALYRFNDDRISLVNSDRPLTIFDQHSED